MTSLFKPNEKVLNFFNGFANFGKVEKIEKIKTKKLDDIKNLPLIDFTKLRQFVCDFIVNKN